MSTRILIFAISCLLVERMAAIGVAICGVCVVDVEKSGIKVRAESKWANDLGQAVLSICILFWFDSSLTRICYSHLPCW